MNLVTVNDLESLLNRVGTNPDWFHSGTVTDILRDQTLPDYSVAVEVFNRMRVWVEADGWTVREQEFEAGHFGNTDLHRRTITLAIGLNPLAKARVFAHELGHVYGHGPTRADMAVTETIAESVSFLIAQAMGWPDTAAAYMTKGMGEGRMGRLRELIRNAAPTTVATANEIIKGAGLEGLVGRLAA